MGHPMEEFCYPFNEAKSNIPEVGVPSKKFKNR
jgi:hypothetical protein